MFAVTIGACAPRLFGVLFGGQAHLSFYTSSLSMLVIIEIGRPTTKTPTQTKRIGEKIMVASIIAGSIFNVVFRLRSTNMSIARVNKPLIRISTSFCVLGLFGQAIYGLSGT
jgi:hypothetical protein